VDIEAIDRRHLAVDVTPSASRLTDSLRDIGYDFDSALADLVDNSIAAGATRVEIESDFQGGDSFVTIADNGFGMTKMQLTEALRFGTRRSYIKGELGRYGLGLKTASISQCRRVTVVTRRGQERRRISALSLDLDHIEKTDRWEIITPSPCRALDVARRKVAAGPGTVVIWGLLDRILIGDRVDSGWSRRRLEQAVLRSKAYLSMVFHRYIEGRTESGKNVELVVNGEQLAPWDPFASGEPRRRELDRQVFEIPVAGHTGEVILRRYVLPSRDEFSSVEEFERMSGPLKWNRQQGLYIYRADRLIQFGGWSGLRSLDEHTKLARASIDFNTDLDRVFELNVSKMRAALPAEMRTLIERPIHELCHAADLAYRGRADDRTDAELPQRQAPYGETGTLLLAAALSVGEHEALERIMAGVRAIDPQAAKSLGW